MPSSCSTLTEAELPQVKKKKSYVYAHGSFFSHIQFFVNLWTALLEHYISYCCSCQLLSVPGTARTPVTQAAALPLHLALTGANPSPPGEPQEQTPVDNPHAEVEIKPQLKPRGSVAKDEDPKPSHQLYKLQIKSTQSTRQIVCLWNI